MGVGVDESTVPLVCDEYHQVLERVRERWAGESVPVIFAPYRQVMCGIDIREAVDTFLEVAEREGFPVEPESFL